MVRFVLVMLKAAQPCKLKLNTAILDFGRFEVGKNPIFHNSYRRPQISGFFVSNAESSLTSKYAHNKAILDFRPI